MFEKFGENLYEGGNYEITEVEKNKLFTATHCKAEKRERWSRVLFQVKMIDDGQEFDCECGQYQHMGILCCHVLKVYFPAMVRLCICYYFRRGGGHVFRRVCSDGL